MGAHAPDKVVATVRALALQGYGPTGINERTGIPLSTVKRWIREWTDLAPEQSRELANAELRIARRLDNIMETRLDAVESGAERVAFRDLAVTWGISRSKLHERAQRQPNGAAINITFQLVEAQRSPEPQLPQTLSNHTLK